MFARGNLSERFKIYIFFQANCSEALHLCYESLKDKAYCFLFQFELKSSRKITKTQPVLKKREVCLRSTAKLNDIPAVHVTQKSIAR